MALRDWGVVDRDLKNGERWASFLVIFFTACLAAFNMMKASPAILFIANDINMPPSMISQIMGSYSIPALLFAYVGMIVAQKLGFRFGTLLSAALMLIGSCICLFVTTPVAFLCGRIAEGIGYGIVAVIGPNCVARLFPRNKLGLPMGIWSQWITVGNVCAMFLAPILFNLAGGAAVPFSWHAIWIGAIVIEIVLAILSILFVKMPRVTELDRAAAMAKPNEDGKKKFAGKDFMAGAIIFSVAFIAMAYVNVVAVNAMYPAFLQNTRGMSVQGSSYFLMIASVLAVPLGIFAGVFADKYRCRKIIIWAGYLLGAVCMILLWTEGTSMVVPTIGILLYSLFLAGPATCTRALIPQLVVSPSRTDFALSTMGFLMALGKVLGGFGVSPSIQAWGYSGMMYYTLIPMLIVAALLVLLFVKSDKFIDKTRAEEAAQQTATE